VNCISINTIFALRTGCFDHKMEQYTDKDTMQKVALEKYNKLKGDKDERIVTGSDDCSLYMWCPKVSAQPTKRLLGHQLPVNHCQFSPNSQYIVSASYDKSIRLWNGYSGDSLSVCRGHISAVYLISWSLDSRMLVSASKDSTMKIWDAKTRKLMFDLPGHADEVYAIDWSPDGEKVASGSKDRMLRIWKN
jgi:ribosome assembly protein 4